MKSKISAIAFSLIFSQAIFAQGYGPGNTSLAKNYKTAQNVCGKVTSISSSADYIINQNDMSARNKGLGMIVDGKAHTYIFDSEHFLTSELHADAKEMANTALANPHLELCLKVSFKNKNTNEGTMVYGFQWVQVSLRAKPSPNNP